MIKSDDTYHQAKNKMVLKPIMFILNEYKWILNNDAKLDIFLIISDDENVIISAEMTFFDFFQQYCVRLLI